MPESPQKDDPDGTESMSSKEYTERMDKLAREMLGVGQEKENKDPEGTRPKK